MAGLKVTWRGKVAYASGSIEGDRIRKSLGTSLAGQAEELCAQYEAKLWKRRSYGEEAVRTFDEAAVSYLQEGGEGRFLPPLIKRFRGRLLGTIKPGEITKAARELYPLAKPGTRNRHVIAPMRAVINHAASLGWCSSIMVENFETTKVRRIAVDRDWIDAFLAQADADGLPHLSAAILFMWQNGPRVSEVARVLPEHFDEAARTIVLERTKEEAWEVRHLSDELTVRIANLEKIDGEPLFGYRSRFGIRTRSKAVCRRAGIPFVPSHQAGRHSFATNAFRMGAKPKQVMEAGGWKTARMVLEIYAHEEGAGRTIADMFDTNRPQPKPEIRQVIDGKGRKP